MELAIGIATYIDLFRVINGHTRQHRASDDNWQDSAILMLQIKSHSMRRCAAGVKHRLTIFDDATFV